MLAVAVPCAGEVPIVYEALDIHRLLLGRSAVSILLRRMEGALMKRAALLLTSSPRFLRAYFHNPEFARPKLPTLVVENKPLRLDNWPDPATADELPSGPPWNIGWFGMLRCRRSLEILAELARRRPDLFRIRIFGRAAGPVRERLDALAREIPALEFGGAYAACDLARLYSDVHFSWAIDYFEENANSEWLLPNRIYEGGSCDTVSLALRRTETGRWLDARGLGVLFDNPRIELEALLDGMTPARYRTLKHAAVTAPRAHFIADLRDCERLAEALAELAQGHHRCAPGARARAAA
jgi:succinoglycan biosynthesis protein ExoL